MNDVHGRAADEAPLVAVAQRLASTAREGDLAVRLRGDEFALLVEDLHGQAELDTVADRVHQLLAEPVRLPPQGSDHPRGQQRRHAHHPRRRTEDLPRPRRRRDVRRQDHPRGGANAAHRAGRHISLTAGTA